MPIIPFEMDRESGDHLYLQLFRKIKRQIQEGTLEAGEKLPTIRALSEALKVNTVTVVNAYRCLEEEGLIYKQVGSGSYVSPPEGAAGPAPGTPEEPDRRQLQVGGAEFNFASGTPTTDLFPVARFKEVLNEVLDRDLGEAFGYHDPQGYYPLRSAIAGVLAGQGIQTAPERIQIISGAQQGIDIAAKALLRYGDTALVEAPTYAGALATFRSRGVKVEAFPLTPQGPDLDRLEALLKKHRPKLVYVMPNFHNPTGWTYPEPVKLELLKLCGLYGVTILEDDYASELNFSPLPAKPLKALDRQEQVIYIKSFSKIMMPGLRLGLMTIPPHLAEPLLSAKQSTDVSTFGLTQRAFELFIRKGYWEEQVKTVYEMFRDRYDTFVEGAERLLVPALECRMPQGGIHFWFQVPAAAAEALAREAAARGVLVALGDYFYQMETPEKHLRLSTASLNPEEIRSGLQRFAEAVEAVLGPRTAAVRKDTYTPIL